MSIEALTWALKAPVGGNEKVMLMGLANHAHPDGTESYPGLESLAEYGHCDKSTVRRNLRKLVDAGWAIEDGLGPRGQQKYRLPLDRSAQNAIPQTGDSKLPPVANSAGGGGKTASTPLHEPSLNRPGMEDEQLGLLGEGSKEKTTTTTVELETPKQQMPDGFPDELRPHARQVMKLLREVAQQHNAREVSALALGRTLMARPRKPLVKAAFDFAAWAADPPRPIRDTVASYRTWLDRERDLAGTEVLGDDGLPQTMRVARQGRVHPATAEIERLRQMQQAL